MTQTPNVDAYSNFNALPLRQLKVAILKWPIPLADSAELAIFKENRPFLSTLCTLKIRRIGKRVLELDRYPVSIGKISESDKIATFGRLSGSFSLFDTLSIHSFFILGKKF